MSLGVLAALPAQAQTEPAVPNLTVTAVVDTTDALEVSWDAVDEAFIYSVWWKTGSQTYTHRRGVAVRVTEGSHPTRTQITGLDAGAVYDVQVRVFDSDYWKLAQSEVTGTRTNAEVPAFSAPQFRPHSEGAVGQAEPTVTIAAGTSPVTEGTAAAFTVTLSEAAPTSGLTVNLTVSEAAGSDYVASGNEGAKMLSFASGDTSKTYSVATVGDGDDEPNGSVTVMLNTGTGYTLGTATSASVAVNDDDPAAQPGVTIAPRRLIVSEADDTSTGAEENVATYTVVLDTQPAGNVTVTPMSRSYGLVADPLAATVSTARSDDALVFTTSNWSTPQTVTVTGVDDAKANGRLRAETVTHSVAGYGSVTAPSVTVAVTDDDDTSAPSFAADASIDDWTFTVNQEIARLDLPRARSGDRVTYSLSPSPPSGLTFSANTLLPIGVKPGNLTGTPTAVQGATQYTYTATDRQGRTASLTFSITVVSEDLMPSFPADASIPDQSWPLGQEIAALTLPEATGGNLPLSYIVVSDPGELGLPEGVSFDRGTRTISGTPTDALAATEYTYRAWDNDLDRATLTFTITVTAPAVPNLVVSRVANRTDQLHATWGAVTDADKYRVRWKTGSGAFNDGEETTGRNYTVSGLAAGTTYTVRVDAIDTGTGSDVLLARSEADKATNVAAWAPTVSGEDSTIDVSWPMFANATGYRVQWKTGSQDWSTTERVHTTDAAARRYAIRNVTVGTTYRVRVTAVGSGGDLQVSDEHAHVTHGYQDAYADPAEGDARAIDVEWLLVPGAAGYAVEWDVASEGCHETGATPELANSKDVADGSATKTQISGLTPDTNYYVRVTAYTANGSASIPDGLSWTDCATPTNTEITDVAVAPVDGSSTELDVTWTIGTTANAFPISGYVVQWKTGAGDWSGADEATVGKDATTHRIDGLTAGTTYDLRVVARIRWYGSEKLEFDGDSAEGQGTTSSAGDSAPSFGGSTVPVQRYTQNTAIQTLTLPAATGGNGTLTYTLEGPDGPHGGKLPVGLDFDANTRQLTGTPTGSQPKTTYTYRATDADGDPVSMAVDITIRPDATSIGWNGTGIVLDHVWTKGTEIAVLRLPRVTGATGGVTFTLTPTPPAGLNFAAAANRGRLSGTPSAATAKAAYTYRAEDSAGNAVETTFAITVEEASGASQAAARQTAPARSGDDDTMFAIYHDPDGPANSTGRHDEALRLLKAARITYDVRTVTGTAKVDRLAGVSNSVLPRFFLGDPEASGWGPSQPKVNNGGLRWLRAKLAALQSSSTPVPTLSVADASAEESSGSIAFTVTLSSAAGESVSVDYATSDGTAVADTDYTPASGTLTFAAGETSKTVTVVLLDDAHDEGTETFTLTLSNPRPSGKATLADATATGSISNADPLQTDWLARFGRAAATDAIAAVTARLETPPDAGSHLTVAGQRLAFVGPGAPTEIPAVPVNGAGGASWPSWSDDPAGFESRTMSARELLMGTSFRAVFAPGARSQFTGWGQGASVSQFSSGGPGLSLSGETATGSMGMDYERGRLLAGFAMTHSLGAGEAHGAGRTYAMGSTVTTMLPYARLRLSQRISAWGLAGTGTGRLSLDLDGAGSERYRTDLTMTLAAVGVRGDLVLPAEANGFALALKADAFRVRTESGAVSALGVGNLAGARADASRVRAILDGSRSFALAGARTLTPSVTLGLRHEGGDAETGTGVELGASLGYADPSRGLDMELRVHGLAAHADDGYGDWGVSGSLQLAPGGAGRGLTASFTPSYGADPGRADRLWTLPDASGLAMNEAVPMSSRLDAEVGYGIAIFGGGFTGTPNFGFGLSDTARELRMGWRLSPAGGGSFEVHLDAARRDAVSDDAPEHRIGFGLTARW